MYRCSSRLCVVCVLCTYCVAVLPHNNGIQNSLRTTVTALRLGREERHKCQKTVLPNWQRYEDDQGQRERKETPQQQYNRISSQKSRKKDCLNFFLLLFQFVQNISIFHKRSMCAHSHILAENICFLFGHKYIVSFLFSYLKAALEYLVGYCNKKIVRLFFR